MDYLYSSTWTRTGGAAFHLMVKVLDKLNTLLGQDIAQK